MSFTEIRNPRFDRPFSVALFFKDFSLRGTAQNPSAYGASIEISAFDYKYLDTNAALWGNGCRIMVTTSLNDLPASINSLYKKDDKYFVSLKLLDDRTWYK